MLLLFGVGDGSSLFHCLLVWIRKNAVAVCHNLLLQRGRLRLVGAALGEYLQEEARIYHDLRVCGGIRIGPGTLVEFEKNFPLALEV